jgi:hypothetical protein
MQDLIKLLHLASVMGEVSKQVRDRARELCVILAGILVELKLNFLPTDRLEDGRLRSLAAEFRFPSADLFAPMKVTRGDLGEVGL